MPLFINLIEVSLAAEFKQFYQIVYYHSLSEYTEKQKLIKIVSLSFKVRFKFTIL